MPERYEKIAEIVSMTFNAPLIIFITYALIILKLRVELALQFFIVSSLFSSILPFTIFTYMVKKGSIQDIFASVRQTRINPLVSTLMSFLCGVIVLQFLNASESLISFMVCLFINTFVIMIITEKWKISIHAASIMCPVTFLVYKLGYGMIPFFLLVFPVAWARLKLGAHDSKQIIAGSLIAFALTIVQLQVFS